jgi:hypothetical protein
MPARLAPAILLATAALAAVAADAPTVGFPATTEVWLPGPELAAVSVDDRRAPVTLRVDRVTPERDGFRYTLVYTGLEPGRFDLRNLLKRADGRPAEGLPPIPVEVTGLRPPGEIRVHEAAIGPPTRFGGYRVVVAALGIVWAVGLLGMVAVAVRRRQKRRPPPPVVEPTLAGCLRPLVEAVVAGTATPADLAALERLLLAVWVRRLDLAGLAPGALMDRLCRHEEVGPLVGRLALWLHAPPVADRTTDVAALLAPYRHFPADAPEAPAP